MEDNVKENKNITFEETKPKEMLENKLKKLNRKKITLQVLLIIFSLAVLIISLITLASTVKASNLAFGRYRFYIMKSQSQSGIAEFGDLVIAKKMDQGAINVGDNIVYRDGEFYYCEKIVETRKSNVVNKIIIAEKDGVKYRFNETDIEGKIVKNIHDLGDVLSFLKTPVGFIFFILIVICIFLLLRVAFIRNFSNN